MAYLSDCEWDIFVSYAHDDKPKIGPAANWIVKFVEGLAVELNRYTGVHFNIYFDQNAQRFNEEIGGILEKVRRSAIFLMIGSPNFLQSSWCRNEIRTFRESVDDTSRIFIAEIMGLRGRAYPVEVPNNLQARFWENEGGAPMTLTPGEKKYKLLLAQMATQICGKLEELKQSEEAAPTPRPDTGDGAERDEPALAGDAERVPGRVFVAWGREVDEEREQLIAYLDGIGVKAVALPADLPSDRAEFQALLQRGLDDSSVYVQLFSRRPLRPFAEGETSPTEIQLDEARKRLGDRNAFLWRPDDLDPERNPDEAYKGILRQAENPSIPELARSIRERMLEKNLQPPPGADEPLVVVINADPEDREFADDLMDACEGRDCLAYLDDYGMDEEARSQWADAAAVAFVQGKVPRAWLTARSIVFNRARAARGGAAAPKGQAILYAPPGPKAQVRIPGADRVEQIDVSGEWSVTRFEQWLDGLGARRLAG